MSEVIVYKNRTNTLRVNLGFDVSGDDFESQIKDGKLPSSNTLGTWNVDFVTDGTNGQLLLTLDDSAVDWPALTVKKGYMDLKRISGGEPLPVFADILTVVFKETLTA